MTLDERNLLLLLARMVLSMGFNEPDDQELKEAIRKIEQAEDRERDKVWLIPAFLPVEPTEAEKYHAYCSGM
jgi:cytosine/adenosine deaminase-related metal-dependent hydrolase